jgi:hypothetical protein
MGKKEEALKVFKEAASLDGDLDLLAIVSAYLKGKVVSSHDNISPSSLRVPPTRSSALSSISPSPSVTLTSDEPPPLEKDDELPSTTTTTIHTRSSKNAHEPQSTYI